MTNEEIWQKIKDNEVDKKLPQLKKLLSKDERLTNFTLSEPDFSFPQDPTIWVTGFHEIVRAQIKMQLTGKTVIVNLRPGIYNSESRENFSRLMEKTGFEVKDSYSKIYSPAADTVLKEDYPRGFN